MIITYKTYARFAEVFDREGKINLPSDATLIFALNTLCAGNSDKRELLFESDGELRRYVIIMVNNVRMDSDELETALVNGDIITLYPPVSGG